MLIFNNVDQRLWMLLLMMICDDHAWPFVYFDVFCIFLIKQWMLLTCKLGCQDDPITMTINSYHPHNVASHVKYAICCRTIGNNIMINSSWCNWLIITGYMYIGWTTVNRGEFYWVLEPIADYSGCDLLLHKHGCVDPMFIPWLRNRDLLVLVVVVPSSTQQAIVIGVYKVTMFAIKW